MITRKTFVYPKAFIDNTIIYYLRITNRDNKNRQYTIYTRSFTYFP